MNDLRAAAERVKKSLEAVAGLLGELQEGDLAGSGRAQVLVRLSKAELQLESALGVLGKAAKAAKLRGDFADLLNPAPRPRRG